MDEHIEDDFIPRFEDRFDIVIPDGYFQNLMLTPALEINHDINNLKAVSTLEGIDLLTGERILLFNPFIVQGVNQ